MAEREDDCGFFMGFKDAQNLNLMVLVIFVNFGNV
jgi:hypothetical protein